MDHGCSGDRGADVQRHAADMDRSQKSEQEPAVTRVQMMEVWQSALVGVLSILCALYQSVLVCTRPSLLGLFTFHISIGCNSFDIVCLLPFSKMNGRTCGRKICPGLFLTRHWLVLVWACQQIGILESLDPGPGLWTRECWTLDRDVCFRALISVQSQITVNWKVSSFTLHYEW